MTDLSEIKVLFRAPDSLALWGIPYEMRPGQAPRNLWDGNRREDVLAQARGYVGATMSAPGPREGWVWLGTPGWWGNLNSEAQRAIQEFLAPLKAKGAVPGWPYEWVSIAEW